jgi:hypothetical protein
MNSMLGVGILMDSQIFKVQLQGTKPIALKSSSYHWKAIETEMSKMGSHRPFEHLKHKLWSKERPIIKLVIWLSTTKSRESTQFLVCKRLITYCWKILNKGYNFASNLIIIGGLHAKLCAPKVTGIPIVGISGLPLGSPGTKSHLDVAPWRAAKYTIRGKVVDSPKSGPWWGLWVWVVGGLS